MRLFLLGVQHVLSWESLGSHVKRLHCVLDWDCIWGCSFVEDFGMSGFKGTPGTWEVHQEDGGISIRQAGTTECGLGWSSYTQIAAELNNIHDARLAAMAPELLEALQNMIGAFDNPIVRRKLPSDFNSEAILSARAAINKALGK